MLLKAIFNILLVILVHNKAKRLIFLMDEKIESIWINCLLEKSVMEAWGLLAIFCLKILIIFYLFRDFLYTSYVFESVDMIDLFRIINLT